MKKILNYILIGMFISFAYNCEQDDSASVNYVTFESSPTIFEVDNNATTTSDIKVYSGNVTGSDRTFTVTVDPSSTLGTSYSVPSTVTIPGGSNVGNLAVSVTDDDSLQFVPQTIVLDFQDESGVSFGDSLVINVAEACPNTQVRVAITTDTWPDETTWELFDGSGGLVGSGGPYDNTDDVDDNTTFNYDFCLASGNYEIFVYDAYGDGGGSYVVSAGGTTLASGAVATFEASSTFTVE